METDGKPGQTFVRLVFCGNWTSVAVACGLLMPFDGFCFLDGGRTKEPTFSCKPTGLMVATFVAIEYLALMRFVGWDDDTITLEDLKS